MLFDTLLLALIRSLFALDVPGKPFDVRLLDHRSRQIQLSWAPPPDGNSPITRYIIRYAPLQGKPLHVTPT